MLRPQAEEKTPLAVEIFFFVTFILAQIVFFRIVYARLTQEGIEYRRWHRWKQVKWDEMASIERFGPMNQFVIRRKDKSLWNRYVLLPSPTPSLNTALGSSPGLVRFRSFLD
jgi:hypothetical protein